MRISTKMDIRLATRCVARAMKFTNSGIMRLITATLALAEKRSHPLFRSEAA